MRILCLTLCLLILGAMPAQAGDTLAKVEWKGFSLSYPSHWDEGRDSPTGEAGLRLSLSSGAQPVVNLLIFLNSESPTEGADEVSGAQIAEAFCLPIALDLAGKVNERIRHKPSRIELGGVVTDSVLFMVDRPPEVGSDFVSMDCFAQTRGGRGIAGVIFSGGVPGQLMQSPAFQQASRQAYAVVNSIRF